MHMESFPSLVCLCLPIGSTSVGGIDKAVDFTNPLNRCNRDGVLDCGPGEYHDEECNEQE